MCAGDRENNKMEIINKDLRKSKLHSELKKRYSNEGYYALAALVLILALSVYVSYEAIQLVESVLDYQTVISN